MKANKGLYTEDLKDAINRKMLVIVKAPNDDKSNHFTVEKLYGKLCYKCSMSSQQRLTNERAPAHILGRIDIRYCQNCAKWPIAPIAFQGSFKDDTE